MATDYILDGVKKNLGLGVDYDVFDYDIITHINSVFFTLNQIGIGPAGFFVEDGVALWSAFLENDTNLNVVKTYMYLRVRLLFDPPATSFAITAMKEQISEFEWRLQVYAESKARVTNTTAT